MALGGTGAVAETAAGARGTPPAATLHQQLVAYTDAVSGALLREQRAGVWSEHSYARGRAAPSASVCVLLAPPAAPPAPAPARLHVAGPPRAPPSPPGDRIHDDEEDDPPDHMECDDEWEERVAANPPSQAHAQLAHAALEVLRDARLARLAGPGGGAARRERARTAAGRLRAALAPLWARGGPPALRPPAWLHAQLSAHLPAVYRPLYEDALAELRRAVPRLADRLGAARLPPPADDPLDPDKERAVRGAAEPGPWLAWVRCGCGREEARWERRLGAALHTRVLPGAPAAGAARPERWAAAALHAAKVALAEVIEDAGERPVVVGGAGAGAGVAAALAAGGAAVRGALLVAPAPRTAEGPRDLPDDVLNEISVPVLLVMGGAGAGALAGGARRVLAVAGADAALRLPPRARRRLRLPQQALDAKLVEEMVGWCRRLAEAAPPAADEYAHLPALAPLAPAPAPPAPAPAAPATPAAASAAPAPSVGSRDRQMEFAEGRVVTRVSGSTPLLLTPRRAPPGPPPAGPPGPPGPLAAADIMQLPIVFADDEPPALAPLVYSEAGAGAGAAVGGAGGAGDKPVTVTAGGARGGVRYTRVIVAKRRGRMPRAAPR